MQLLLRLVIDEQGQDLIEYGLLAAFIVLAVVGSVAAVGTALTDLYWGDMTTAINSASGS